jgi:hypothetical protein
MSIDEKNRQLRKVIVYARSGKDFYITSNFFVFFVPPEAGPFASLETLLSRGKAQVSLRTKNDFFLTILPPQFQYPFL